MKTSVVILNWNGRSLMERFLAGVVARTENADTEVVVADNGSTDDSVEWLKNNFPATKVHLICLDRNYGFAEGYNKAIRLLDSKYVVLLNSDVEVTQHWLDPMVSYLDAHPDVAACQPKILSVKYPDTFEHAGAAGGFIDRLGYPFCRGRIQANVEKDQGQYDTPCDVFWATGACFCISRKAFEKVGGLDARFFAHMEEIDMCWRLRSSGLRIVCLPESSVYHVGGATLDKENPRKTFLNFRNNLLMLYKNLPEKRLKTVFLQRFFLDMLAAVFFLLKAEFGNFAAVFKARHAYRRMRPEIKADRMRNLQEAVLTDIPEIYHGVSIMDYYLKGKKVFSSLKF